MGGGSSHILSMGCSLHLNVVNLDIMYIKTLYFLKISKQNTYIGIVHMAYPQPTSSLFGFVFVGWEETFILSYQIRSIDPIISITHNTIF